MARTPRDSAEALARLVAAGPAALDDREALQLAAGLRADEAAALLDAFGSLPEVLAASPAAAARYAPTPAAARVGLLKDISRRLLAAPLRARPLMSGWDAVADYLRAMLAGRTREQLLGLFLDKRNRLMRVHLTVRALSDTGQRLNPKKADLEVWRQTFAQTLRERGVAAEATPRRARGVTRKGERGPIRRIRNRHEQGRAVIGQVAREKLRQAAAIAFSGLVSPTAWEQRIADRQARIRRVYLAQARLLQASSDSSDRMLGSEVEHFVRSLAPPDTERLALARALREANELARRRPREERAGKDRG